MSTEQPPIEELLDPISDEQPCGVNLRWTPDWDRIKEARRSDDNLGAGQWEKKDHKSANWRQLEELTFAALRTKSKDLQLAMWFTEAGLKLRGFSGLGQGFHLLRELLAHFWDRGLFPLIESGPEDRAGPLEWLNDKLTESVLDLPITRRNGKGDDFSFLQLQAAMRTGSEASFKSKDGEIDEAKRKAYTEALAAGGVSMEMYYAALRASELPDYENLNSEVEAVYKEFKALEQVIDEKFGETAAPNLSNIRGVLREIKEEVFERLKKKRPATEEGPDGAVTTVNSSLSGFALPLLGGSSANGSWQEAEKLIRSGKVDAGLSAMTRLAAAETGRNRFQRKLLLAEVCLSSRRTELARAILEELAEQIDTFKLSDWESSDLVGGVWTRLYRLYKTESGDKDRAKDLFERLCRLDPWQALSCEE
jgi:type VI secretion system protein ImpA